MSLHPSGVVEIIERSNKPFDEDLSSEKRQDGDTTPRKLREASLFKLKAELEEQGYEVELFLNTTVDEIIEAISQKGTVEGIDITDRMQKGNFRFVAYDFPLHSLKISHSMAALLKNSKSIETQNAAIQSGKKRSNNADDFAKSMFGIVEKVKQEQNITSFRGIVDELNRQKIQTYRKGKKSGSNTWHVSTLQNLNARWIELGLVPNDPTKTKKPEP